LRKGRVEEGKRREDFYMRKVMRREERCIRPKGPLFIVEIWKASRQCGRYPVLTLATCSTAFSSFGFQVRGYESQLEEKRRK